MIDLMVQAILLLNKTSEVDTVKIGVRDYEEVTALNIIPGTFSALLYITSKDLCY